MTPVYTTYSSMSILKVFIFGSNLESFSYLLGQLLQVIYGAMLFVYGLKIIIEGLDVAFNDGEAAVAQQAPNGEQIHAGQPRVAGKGAAKGVGAGRWHASILGAATNKVDYTIMA